MALTLLGAFSCGQAEREHIMLSRFSADLDRSLPLAEYPRPQMTRGRWLNLNGTWDYAVTASDAASSAGFDEQILVPFAIESTLSGVRRTLTPEESL